MIELKHIDKYYNIGTVNEVCLFKDFNLTVDDGDFISVIGSNGSGKTSMLNLICGSLEAEAGNIILNGEDISHQKEYIRQRKIGRVYQNPAMGTCPSMTILENMSLADNKGKKFGLGFGTNKKRVDYYRELLSQLGLGLEDMMGSKVGSLSGGQRQAMALLMTTMAPIEILILDEHTAALDPKTAELIMELTGKVVKEKKIKMDSKTYDCLKSMLDNFDKTDFYTTKTFENGYSMRKVLDYNLSDRAAADKEAADKEIKAGASRDSVLKKYTSDKSFEKWYKGFCQAMKNAQNSK